MTALNDQLGAAVRDARNAVTTTLGLPADHHTVGSSPFLDELLDAYCRPETPRCGHLRSRPAQVWMMALPFPGWHCRPCAATQAEANRGRWLGQVEEHTCDRCRRYLPSERLMLAMLRQDLFVVVASLCRRCTALAQQHGAAIATVGGEAATDA